MRRKSAEPDEPLTPIIHMMAEARGVKQARLTDAEAASIVRYPDRWSQYFRTINGHQFSLKNRPYLIDIYRHFARGNEAPRILMLKCSRKVEKTETILNLLLYGLINMPYFTAVYTAPRQATVSRFVEERFKGALMSSINGGCLRSYLRKDASTHMTFDVGRDRYNHLYAYSGYGDAHSLLGIDGDMVCIDEFQDMGPGALEMIMEIVTQSPHKWVIVSGTAREQGSEFHRLWRQSTQNEWREGKWIRTNNECEGDIVGYHITQTMHPDVTPEDIEFKRETYPPRKFLNEVMGEFYSGGMKPITLDMMMACCDSELDMVRSLDPPDEAWMGVDWGKETTYVIMDKSKRVLTAGKIDSQAEDEVAVIKDLILKYNVVQAVCDLGYGARQVKELQDEFGDRVASCYYSSRPRNPYQFTKRDSNRNLIYMATVDKTSFCEETIDAVDRQRITIPWRTNELQWLVDECCNLNSSRERDEASSVAKSSTVMTRYGRDGDDHAFHAILYALLCERVAGESDLPMMRTLGI